MGRSEKHPVVRAYTRLARGYDERWAFYVGATTRSTIARLGPLETERLLDVGCGTGALLRALVTKHPGARLTGIDPVPAMLESARDKLPAEVGLCVGWAEQLPFADRAFDVLVSANTFHFVRDPYAALAEMRRVLRPGGRLVLTDWCDDYLACRLCDLCLRLFDRAHFKTYGTRECAARLEQAGFTGVRVERYRISWLWGLMTAMARAPGSRNDLPESDGAR